MTHDERLWWERGVIYQVYPRSYTGSDGDGIGDLAGLARRLDEYDEGVVVLEKET